MEIVFHFQFHKIGQFGPYLMLFKVLGDVYAPVCLLTLVQTQKRFEICN